MADDEKLSLVVEQRPSCSTAISIAKLRELKPELTRQKHSPRFHLLDRRASDISEHSAGAPDDLLSTRQLVGWLGVSQQWAEIGRCKGYGPPFVRLSPHRIRYRRRDVLEWLAERAHHATSEYV